MKLVIVESPTKAKTIGKFLGKGYEIRASMGHIMDLPKSKLGVDLEHDFAPQYEMVEDRKKIIIELKKLAKEADDIVLATDPDREGEGIAAHVAELLSSQTKTKKNQVKLSRVVFHEITKDAIEEAFQHPRDLDERLVAAQTARRVLDRLVGYKLSPLLWQKVRRGLSAGRVQSVALRFIVEREKEIKAFQKEEYWTLSVKLSRDTDEIEFNLIEINGEKIESQKKFTLYDGEYTISKTSITNEEMAKKIETELQTKQFIVADVIKKETKRSPQTPFTTSTLQQDASRRFGYSGKRTMSLAQKLYEEGFITYHRTDSVSMAVKAVMQMRDFVKKQFGDIYIPASPRMYKTKQKLAQEAHEAIRPTDVFRSKQMVADKLGADYAKLYELIWIRAVASQMSDSRIESTTVLVDAGVTNQTENTYRFKTTGSILVFDGFLKVNPFGLQDRKLPQFVSSEQLQLLAVLPEKHETPPPPRYNDASLVSSLESAGIGRPSTYATIISTIESRAYIEREQGRFKPTSVGNAVNDFLVQHFSDIDDIPFTARIEDELDAIAQGEKTWVPVMKEFYTPFEERLSTVKNAERVKIEVEETDETCPKCGNPLVVRTGRFGKFLSCSTFPACDFKKAFVEQTNITCPKCNQGQVIGRKTRKGRTFYGCSRYPDCDFAVWKLTDIGKEPTTQKTKRPTKKTSKTKTVKKTTIAKTKIKKKTT